MSRADDGGRTDVGEDPELRAAIRAGDLGAFERVVRTNGRALLTVAQRLL